MQKTYCSNIRDAPISKTDLILTIVRNGSTYDMTAATHDAQNEENETRNAGSNSESPTKMESVVLRQSTPGMVGRAKLNTIKITLTLVGVFLACWTPYYVMCLW